MDVGRGVDNIQRHQTSKLSAGGRVPFKTLVLQRPAAYIRCKAECRLRTYDD